MYKCDIQAVCFLIHKVPKIKCFEIQSGLISIFNFLQDEDIRFLMFEDKQD